MTYATRFLNFYRRHWAFMSIIALLIILRAALLLVTPPGFFLDEAAGAAHVVALLSNGTNTHGESWPLYSASLGGGYTTPVYLYPLAAWATLAGTSEYALRAFSLFATALTALLLGYILRLWTDNKTALIGIIVALTLPWGWVQGSLAWDPALVPLLAAAALAGFSMVLKATSPTRQIIGIVMTGLSLILLAYLYPPCRVTAPLLLVALYGLLYWQKKISFNQLLVFAPLYLFLCLPLLHFMIQPEALGRSSQLSVLHDASLGEAFLRGAGNIASMISPMFLFATGDSNLRHATGQQGMLGLAGIIPLGMLLVTSLRALHRHRTNLLPLLRRPLSILMVVSILGILLSVLGSALTTEGQPHSLRATAAWPFYVVLIALGWKLVLERCRTAVAVAAIVAGSLATVWYVVDLSIYYPQRSAESFDVSTRKLIQNGTPPESYPGLSLYYYKNR